MGWGGWRTRKSRRWRGWGRGGVADEEVRCEGAVVWVKEEE